MNMKSELSPQSLLEGVQAQLTKKFPLENFIDPEVESAIGQTLAEKREQGFAYGVILFPIYAPFFLSGLPEILELRTKLVKKKVKRILSFTLSPELVKSYCF